MFHRMTGDVTAILSDMLVGNDIVHSDEADLDGTIFGHQQYWP